MRVMADKEPKKKVIPSGGEVPYTISREFPENKMMAKKYEEADPCGEKEDEEQEQVQQTIDGEMQGFLNGENQEDVMDTGGANVSSSSGINPSKVMNEKEKAKDELREEHKREMDEFKAEMKSMMEAIAKMSSRQDQAEQRQQQVEKRMEGAISEIVDEQKACRESAKSDINDIKTMLASMAQQQMTMMQTIQGDDRRVKAKTNEPME